MSLQTDTLTLTNRTHTRKVVFQQEKEEKTGGLASAAADDDPGVWAPNPHHGDGAGGPEDGKIYLVSEMQRRGAWWRANKIEALPLSQNRPTHVSSQAQRQRCSRQEHGTASNLPCGDIGPKTPATDDRDNISHQPSGAAVECRIFPTLRLSAGVPHTSEQRQHPTRANSNLWDRATQSALACKIAPSHRPVIARARLLPHSAKPQPQLADPAFHRETSGNRDDFHRQFPIFIHIRGGLGPNVGAQLRWEWRANRTGGKISGRKDRPTRPDILLPPPFRHPPVRGRLAPNGRSRAQIRLGPPGCGPPLSHALSPTAVDLRVATRVH